MCKADYKNLATSMADSGKPQLIYSKRKVAEAGKIIGFIPGKSIVVSTVQLNCCETFAICCTLPLYHTHGLFEVLPIPEMGSDRGGSKTTL